ncbi:MAG: thermonuclease family protein, partial [Salinibacter sp.]
TSVKLKTSSSLGDKKDSYGRLLAYVYLDLDGDDELEMLNKALLRQGYATLTGFKHDLQRDFREIAKRAEDKGRGLWGQCRLKGARSVEVSPG